MRVCRNVRKHEHKRFFLHENMRNEIASTGSIQLGRAYQACLFLCDACRACGGLPPHARPTGESVRAAACRRSTCGRLGSPCVRRLAAARAEGWTLRACGGFAAARAEGWTVRACGGLPPHALRTGRPARPFHLVPSIWSPIRSILSIQHIKHSIGGSSTKNF